MEIAFQMDDNIDDNIQMATGFFWRGSGQSQANVFFSRMGQHSHRPSGVWGNTCAPYVEGSKFETRGGHFEGVWDASKTRGKRLRRLDDSGFPRRQYKKGRRER